MICYLELYSTVFTDYQLAYGPGGIAIYMGPMALALGYGILFATLLTLVLVSCLYLIGEDMNK